MRASHLGRQRRPLGTTSRSPVRDRCSSTKPAVSGGRRRQGAARSRRRLGRRAPVLRRVERRPIGRSSSARPRPPAAVRRRAACRIPARVRRRPTPTSRGRARRSAAEPAEARCAGWPAARVAGRRPSRDRRNRLGGRRPRTSQPSELPRTIVTGCAGVAGRRGRPFLCMAVRLYLNHIAELDRFVALEYGRVDDGQPTNAGGRSATRSAICTMDRAGASSASRS
jgi:hypothetical protein